MQTFKQFITEEYTYMYSNLNIDKKTLFNAVILAHEIEYKWSKLKNTHSYLEQPFLKILVPIFEKYKKLMLFGCRSWVYVHAFCIPQYNSNPTDIKTVIMYWYENIHTSLAVEVDSPQLEEFIRILQSKYKLKDPRFFLRYNDIVSAHAEIKKYVNTIPPQTLQRIKTEYNDIYSIFDKNWLELESDEVEGAHDPVCGDMIKVKNILLNTDTTNIGNIMRSITLTLNIEHVNGLIISDYLNPTDAFTDEQLDQISDLPTYKWDKEINKEFNI